MGAFGAPEAHCGRTWGGAPRQQLRLKPGTGERFCPHATPPPPGALLLEKAWAQNRAPRKKGVGVEGERGPASTSARDCVFGASGRLPSQLGKKTESRQMCADPSPRGLGTRQQEELLATDT